MSQNLKKEIIEAESKNQVGPINKGAKSIGVSMLCDTNHNIMIDIVQCVMCFQHQIVWVSCEGENVADIEHIGPIRYIPQKGFPSQYFPYKNQEGYLSPLVAVHFEKPKRK